MITVKTAWNRLGRTAIGRWCFSRLICFKAPYFSTIRPRFYTLEPGLCEIKLRKRRAVLNHLGTIHAIAMCNAAELAAGLAMDVSLPASYRWIPKGMRVSYLKPAKTDLVATAHCPLPADLTENTTLVVTVDIKDTTNVVVFQAEISMYVSARHRNP